MSSRVARGFGVLAGALAMALAVESFSTWFVVDGVPSDMWQSFGVVDIFVGLCIASAAGAGISAVLGERSGMAVVLATISANISFVVLILICWRTLDPPGAEAVRESGAWIGLAMSAGIFVLSAAAMGGGSPPRLSSAR